MCKLDVFAVEFFKTVEIASPRVVNVSALLECRLIWGGGDCGKPKGTCLVSKTV